MRPQKHSTSDSNTAFPERTERTSKDGHAGWQRAHTHTHKQPLMPCYESGVPRVRGGRQLPVSSVRQGHSLTQEPGNGSRIDSQAEWQTDVRSVIQSYPYLLDNLEAVAPFRARRVPTSALFFNSSGDDPLLSAALLRHVHNVQSIGRWKDGRLIWKWIEQRCVPLTKQTPCSFVKCRGRKTNGGIVQRVKNPFILFDFYIELSYCTFTVLQVSSQMSYGDSVGRDV